MWVASMFFGCTLQPVFAQSSVLHGFGYLNEVV
jgi:hypothetical protein